MYTKAVISEMGGLVYNLFFGIRGGFGYEDSALRPSARRSESYAAGQAQDNLTGCRLGVDHRACAFDSYSKTNEGRRTTPQQEFHIPSQTF